ncbi:DMT family transporter [Segnochrobactrum spirostomi]|uniref:Multidrug efflux SMR transporter n=1 Tax=Segnochrobactrum spirostomi TaxID=2608987 RepID=A0A6A7Y0L7_9HYPH|nr:multidrug efflux SMR transporter [Segnochrobactrum spirostomi]MQT12620.1 multidrug efflux SMR transporter [Segnochrobactrum spirostomi]
MKNLVTAYAFLAVAIVCEVAGTTFLQKSEQFTRAGPTAAMACLYAASFYCLTLALRTLPLGIAYAIWGGVGIVLTALIGVVVFRQSLDWPAIIGIGTIILGVVIVNAFSRSLTH